MKEFLRDWFDVLVCLTIASIAATPAVIFTILANYLFEVNLILFGFAVVFDFLAISATVVIFDRLFNLYCKYIEK